MMMTTTHNRGNARAATLIAEALRDGLIHPGKPETGQPSVAIPLPFRTTGMPPEMKRNVDATVHLMAEAIVHHLETHRQTIVDAGAFEQLQLDAAPADPDPQGVVTVHCFCDRTRINPLLHLVIKDQVAVIDGAALSPCPHGK